MFARLPSRFSEGITVVREHRLLRSKPGVIRIQFSCANSLIDPPSLYEVEIFCGGLVHVEAEIERRFDTDVYLWFTCCNCGGAFKA